MIPPLGIGGLESTYTIHLKLMGKRIQWTSYYSVNWDSLLGVTFEALRAKNFENRRFARG